MSKQITSGKKAQQQLRIHNAVFVALLLCITGLVAALSVRYDWQADLTYGHRNTLTEPTKKLLKSLTAPLKFTIFATQSQEIRLPIQDLINRYKKHYPDIQVEFIDLDVEPTLARKNNIQSDGEAILTYAKRSEHILLHNEQNYSNTIQQLTRSEQRWLIFVTGHGEREPHRQANHDLSDWVKTLETKGINAKAHNISKLLSLPDNTSVLVIASPQVDFLAGEVEIIQHYIDGGGNLLWLVDPGSLAQLDSVAKNLNLRFPPGMVVDPTSQLFGINDPRFTVVPDYPAHPITDNFSVITLYPQSRGIVADLTEQWQVTEILHSPERSWIETGKLSGNIQYDKNRDTKGPVTLGIAMTREVNLPIDSQTTTAEQKEAQKSGAPPVLKTKQQRIVVVGDGDFLSNAYLGNGGNADMGWRMVNWLSHDDQLLDIPAKNAPDTQVIWSTTTQGVVALFFFLALPLMSAGCGVWIWLRRRKL